MEEGQNTEALRRHYLLGVLSDDENARLETSFLADDDAFEAMEATEDELVEAYVRNNLDSFERERIETRLLASPRLLEKAKFVHALEKSLASRGKGHRSGYTAEPTTAADPPESIWQRIFGKFFMVPSRSFGGAMAACSVLLLVFGTLLVIQWRRLNDQEQRLRSERAALEQQFRSTGQQFSNERARAEQLNAELNKVKERGAQNEKELAELRAKLESPEPSKLPSSTFGLVLFAGGSRGDKAGNDVKLAPGITNIRVTLNLPDDNYTRYRVSIRNSANADVFVSPGLRPQGKSSGRTLVINVPVKRLTIGDYEVRVGGITPSGSVETVEEYPFRVSRTEKQ